jgi:hypothetical protein
MKLLACMCGYVCRRTGSLFWPDLWWNAWVNDTIYTLVGDMKEAPWVGSKHHRLVDSGQMLFDRVRHPEVSGGGDEGGTLLANKYH